MDEDDPRRPLLGDGRPSAARRLAAELCSVESWRRRLPITIWLPKYTWECLIRDAIAGITVGLTSIPQGIAYAMLAGLPPQVGLYSSIFPGFVYALFGSCKDVTVGPTAILAALLAKYVALSPDFAYLATFLSGCVILLLGVLQLGFLLDFISKPVISGFTTAAALQISASQLKSLFRVTGGGGGGTFISALVNFFKNIKTVHLWDTVLGVSCIVVLLLLKCAAPSPPGAAPSPPGGARPLRARALLHVVRARNALVVFAAALLAYTLAVRDIEPFALTGKIEGGLPQFGPPPFSTVVKNSTLSFEEMLAAFGAEGLVMPLVAILESIAIAKAFAGSAPVDATQEMVALGAVNVLSAFCQSMPSTGSFTRSALNHASGVLTPAGSVFKASLVLIAVTLLSSAFAYIPRAALAAVIVVAMASLVQFDILPTLWYHTKLELCVYCATVVAGACAGLEYGILCGAGLDAARELARAARPNLHLQRLKVGNQDCSVVSIMGPLSYACASRVSRGLAAGGGVLVLDGRHAGHMDLGVAENIAQHVAERSRRGARCLLWNFPARHRRLLERLQPALAAAFVHGASIDQHVLGLDLIR